MRLALAALMQSAVISPDHAADAPKGGDVAAVKAAVERLAMAHDKMDGSSDLAFQHLGEASTRETRPEREPDNSRRRIALRNAS